MKKLVRGPRDLFLDIVGIGIWLLLIWWLAGCEQPVQHTGTIPDLGLETGTEAVEWVADNIHYVSDTIHGELEEWQTPIQTYTWRTGDCEDFAILAAYLAHRTGSHAVMVTGMDSLFFGHAWVMIDGIDYEPQSGFPAPGLRDRYPHRLKEWPIEEALDMAVRRSIQ